MAQQIKLKRSAIAGKVPLTSSLDTGELAINTADGKLYFKRDDDSIQTIVTTNALVTGSLNINGPVTASFFKGDGSAITGVVSSSYALTASYVNPLRQTVEITGSFLVSGSTTQVGNNTLLGNTTLSGSVIISGSANASANFTLQGHLRLDPGQDPGNANVTASYLFTSASNTFTGFDLYYRQNNNLVKFKWLEGMLTTGVLYGGVLSYSGSSFYLTSGSGVIVNHNAVTSSEINPIITYVNWNATTQSIANTGSQNTYVYIDATGSLRQQTSFFTSEQYHELIPIGRVSHYGPNSSTITGVGNNMVTSYDQSSQLGEFVRAFGPLKVSGLTITPQPGSLRINIGSGTSFNLGGYYQYSPDLPSIYNSSTYLTSSIIRIHRSGSGYNFDNNGGSYYTEINPTQWDNGSGTLQTVGNNNWTIQRVFVNPVSGRSHVYYAQSTYATYLDAIGAVSTDDFEESEITKNAYVFAGYLVMQGGAGNTDLSVSGSTNAIIQAGLFRNSVGGSGGASAATVNLNDLADVNITTPSNGQALVYSSGNWINSSFINASISGNAGTATTASYALTASHVNTLTQNVSITGDLVVGGKITAEEFHTEFVSASIIYQSGSTKFGNSSDDVHSFTGSLYTTGKVNIGTVDNFGSDPDKFLALSGSEVVYRTGAQLLSDIGGQTAGTFVQNAGSGGQARYIMRYEDSNSATTSSIYEDTSRRVGIRTTTPAYPLDVSGSFRASSNSNIVGFIKSTSAFGATISYQDPSTSGNDWVSAGAYGNSFVIATGLQVKAVVDVNGHTYPNSDKLQDFGSGSNRWRTVYTDDIDASDTVTAGALDVKGNAIVSGSLTIKGTTAVVQQGILVSGTTSLTVASISTGSYEGAFLDYVIASGSNKRAGTLATVWTPSDIEWNDVSTLDLGSTVGAEFTPTLAGSNANLVLAVPTGTWTVKGHLRYM